MPQINFDPLLKLSSAPQNGLSLKLDPNQFYPARLSGHQPTLLQVQAGNGQLQVELSAQQVKQILRISGSALQSTSAQHNITVTQRNELTAGIGTAIHAPEQHSTELTAGSRALTPVLALLVRLQPGSSGDLQLSVQAVSKSIQLPLNPTQLFNLLQQPPLAPGQTLSTAAIELNNNQAALQVTVTKTADQLKLVLSNQTSLTVPLKQLSQAQYWPEGQNVIAQLRLTQRGQLEVSPLASSGGLQSAGTTLSGQQASSPAALVTGVTGQLRLGSVSPFPPLQINTSATQQLLPLLARQIWPEQIASHNQAWLQQALKQPTHSLPNTDKLAAAALSMAELINQQKPALRWQLSATSAQQFLLQLQPEQAPTQIRVAATELSRPIAFSMQALAASTPDLPPSKDLWRQLLPLSPANADPLTDSPLLPPAVRQLLHFIRETQPDGKQVPEPLQLQQQLNAALQFQPVVSNANTATTAGAIALAISMLLGRLTQSSQADKTPTAIKDKLTQLVGQLDSNQSSQLLKQLAGHSGQLQAAQIATLEQPAQRATEQQFFLQLPLLCGHESRLAEICITQQDSNTGEGAERQPLWQLTMKFNLGAGGELLAKVTLQQQRLTMQFYSDDAATVASAERFLPLLKDRLKIQGVEVTDAGCQLGKIPQHLYQQGTGLLQVRV